MRVESTRSPPSPVRSMGEGARRAGEGLFAAILVLAFVGTLLSSTAAYAADGARFRPIGFSADDRYFAFEQYGVQDGSGFPYYDIFVLDTRADTWVAGSPVRIVNQEDGATLSDARRAAREAAAPLLDSLAISEPADLLAANPFTEVAAARNRLTFHNHYNSALGIGGNPEEQGTFTLTVTPRDVPMPAHCGEGQGDTTGLLLELRHNKSGEIAILHEDDAVPKSRGCPFAYDIEAVVQRSASPEPLAAVAIIGYHYHAFEGSNRRFLAFPFSMPVQQ